MVLLCANLESSALFVWQQCSAGRVRFVFGELWIFAGSWPCRYNSVLKWDLCAGQFGMEANCMEKIDFVITWVDGSDSHWRQQRDFYLGQESTVNEAQYRDWGILRYWFRSVEQYAPWVNQIHFVTCGQIPDWLNTEHPKLHCVNHVDYIPEAYLPTFSSHVIELNLHRIPELAEHFVYFNDDMYINSAVAPTDFFRKGLPCETPILSILAPSAVRDPFVHFLCNDIAVINKHFRKKDVIAKAKWKWFHPCYGKYICRNLYCLPYKAFSAFYNFHIASSLRKSTFKEIWDREPELLHNTCKNKFRGLNDVNQYVMSYYNICKGEFFPRRADMGKFYTIGQQDELLYADILSGKHKLICINDNPRNSGSIGYPQSALIRVFNKKFPNKSMFEK